MIATFGPWFYVMDDDGAAVVSANATKPPVCKESSHKHIASDWGPAVAENCRCGFSVYPQIYKLLQALRLKLRQRPLFFAQFSG